MEYGNTKTVRSLNGNNIKKEDNATVFDFLLNDNGEKIADDNSATVSVKNAGYLFDVPVIVKDSKVAVDFKNEKLQELPSGSYGLEFRTHNDQNEVMIFPDNGFFPIHVNQNAKAVDGKTAAEITIGAIVDDVMVRVNNRLDGIHVKDGVDGKDGRDGINGTNGTNGKDGQSAYQLAVAKGLVPQEIQQSPDPEKAWIESLGNKKSVIDTSQITEGKTIDINTIVKQGQQVAFDLRNPNAGKLLNADGIESVVGAYAGFIKVDEYIPYFDKNGRKTGIICRQICTITINKLADGREEEYSLISYSRMFKILDNNPTNPIFSDWSI
ncbi:hypothetical protein [Convivina praedatoris]|uniref:Uncharacterized protein n=1 Tax=Convivina praedatoris TaxID=2880963 RepID=A0ABM9D3K7_9LACO|nr:hypothetical protein [Convivina sp. LMG 32447]CAH1853295.1 hypothetical protein R077815_00786 [Convivina sp. LMG 32447]CAH1854655.1 hypothetical protein LMG032447_00900 [Convivina sp. LMG 32447]